MSFADYSRQLTRRWAPRRGNLVILAEVDSSHALAMRLMREYLAEGTSPPAVDLLAWSQSGGVGRHGRPWSSPPGAGVYLSLVRPDPGVPLQLLPLAVAVSLCRTVNTLLDDRCRLKWPNDLVSKGRKLGGILIDAVARDDMVPVAVVSFGINHSRDLDALKQPAATSIQAEGGPPVALPELAHRLVSDLEARLAADPADVVDDYRALSVHEPGEALVCRTGDETLCGRFLGIDDLGFLRLLVEGEERRLAAGEVERSEPEVDDD